jgi:5-formyltetrahydrofolate cyclo-ligase
LLQAAGRNASIVFPRVTNLDPRLRFHRVEGPHELVAGPMGLLEPADHCAEVSLDAIDVFVVPGLAFDRRGQRLGYGGGYYDEVAARVRARRDGRRAFLVGVGFDFQMVDRCPAGERDVAIDCVVTDARVVRCDPSLAPRVTALQ